VTQQKPNSKIKIMANKLKTRVVKKSQSGQPEYLITNPPYTCYGLPRIETSQSIIMRVGGLKEMIKDLSDEDSFRIEWFANGATEYSYIINDRNSNKEHE
jgi:hypothetical protein